jgi:hypothetical protein
MSKRGRPSKNGLTIKSGCRGFMPMMPRSGRKTKYLFEDPMGILDVNDGNNAGEFFLNPTDKISTGDRPACADLNAPGFQLDR